MDGNGRWAKKRGLPRSAGHSAGAEGLKKIVTEANRLGVKYITVYAFSTENWARPYEEVKLIMDLFRKYLISSVETCARNNVRARIIGDKSKLSPDIVEAINNLEEKTKDNTGITFQIAMNYGSRDEITRAVRLLSTAVEAGEIHSDEIDEKTIEKFLDTADSPDPDLLIRTSGEERLSNFLMWQLAYTEFYFTDVLWPDFNKDELLKAIAKYSSRDRRYGGIKK